MTDIREKQLKLFMEMKEAQFEICISDIDAATPQQRMEAAISYAKLLQCEIDLRRTGLGEKGFNGETEARHVILMQRDAEDHVHMKSAHRTLASNAYAELYKAETALRLHAPGTIKLFNQPDLA